METQDLLSPPPKVSEIENFIFVISSEIKYENFERLTKSEDYVLEEKPYVANEILAKSKPSFGKE